MAPYRCFGSLLLVASLLLDAHGSPHASAKMEQVDLMDSLSAEDAKMFAAIWAKYAHGDFMSHEQLNSIMHDTDHELGDQLFGDTEWLELCREKGADPRKGLSRLDFLSLYFDGEAHPESTIKKDFTRIFLQGGTPPPPKHARKNLLRKGDQQVDLVDSLSAEDARMFAAIWAKYTQGEFMSHEQLNAVFHDTDQELGDQPGIVFNFNDSEWLELCKEKGAVPSQGLSKNDFLSLYFDDKAHPENSIKKDFTRIFLQGGTPPPPEETPKNLLKSGLQIDLKDSLTTEEALMFAEIWVKYTHGEFMSHEQLNRIFHDTDQELGDQGFNDTEWLELCKEKGADPSKGLSRDNFLSLYFDDKAHPESSIKNDYMRIFLQGGTPPPPKGMAPLYPHLRDRMGKNLLQKSGQQIDEVVSSEVALGQPVEQFLVV